MLSILFFFQLPCVLTRQIITFMDDYDFLQRFLITNKSFSKYRKGYYATSIYDISYVLKYGDVINFTRMRYAQHCFIRAPEKWEKLGQYLKEIQVDFFCGYGIEKILHMLLPNMHILSLWTDSTADEGGEEICLSDIPVQFDTLKLWEDLHICEHENDIAPHIKSLRSCDEVLTEKMMCQLPNLQELIINNKQFDIDEQFIPNTIHTLRFWNTFFRRLDTVDCIPHEISEVWVDGELVRDYKPEAFDVSENDTDSELQSDEEFDNTDQMVDNDDCECQCSKKQRLV